MSLPDSSQPDSKQPRHDRQPGDQNNITGFSQTPTNNDQQAHDESSTLYPDARHSQGYIENVNGPVHQRYDNRNIDTGGGNYAEGNITTNIINNFQALPKWIKAVIVAVGVMITGIFVVVVMPLLFRDPQPPSPDIDRLQSIRATGRLTITAIGTQTVGDQPIVWLGTNETANPAITSLYSLTGAPNKEMPLTHIFDTSATILHIMVDCKGNLWLSLEDQGVLVYNPITGQRDTVINPATTGGWLSKKTMDALATRCSADKSDVEVWLGREGVRTLRYTGAYPAPGSITLTPSDKDQVYQASKAVSSVKALYYSAASDRLWIGGDDGALLALAIDGVDQTTATALEKAVWSLSADAEGKVWGAGGGRLFRADAAEADTPLNLDGATSRPLAMVADRTWRWFGDRCSERSDCVQLGVVSGTQVTRLDIDAPDVLALARDDTGSVWIGTNQGLLVYPASTP